VSEVILAVGRKFIEKTLIPLPLEVELRVEKFLEIWPYLG
jgi:hypothetical protein